MIFINFLKTKVFFIYKDLLNPFSYNIPNPHAFVKKNLLSTVPAGKCPECLYAHGKVTWVIPGRNCPAPDCGTPHGNDLCHRCTREGFRWQWLLAGSGRCTRCNYPDDPPNDGPGSSGGGGGGSSSQTAGSSSQTIGSSSQTAGSSATGNNSGTTSNSSKTVDNNRNIPKTSRILLVFLFLVMLLYFALALLFIYSKLFCNVDLLNGMSYECCDMPRPWGLYFQDSASPQMEALVELHNNIMFYLIITLFSVGWMLFSITSKFSKAVINNKYVSHGTLVELIWTISPGLMLIFIAFTSFKLLYLMDEVSDVNMTFAVEGHQWYWGYQYPDFRGQDTDFIEYDSYLTPESDLQNGALRMLDVDEKVIMPEVSHTRFLISSGDVIHSYACPALGVKCDAYPGRLNQSSSLMNRLGTFFGQCSEICGLLHSSMPIAIKSICLEKFLIFLAEK